MTQDIQGLGYKNDVVKVKPGYGRNYLIPTGVAMIANDSNKRMTAENTRQAAHKASKLKQDAEALAQRIGELTIDLKTKAGETGKIFGAVTAIQIADALKAKGFDIDRKRVMLREHPKQLGTYKVNLDLHKEVKHEITVNVVGE